MKFFSFCDTYYYSLDVFALSFGTDYEWCNEKYTFVHEYAHSPSSVTKFESNPKNIIHGRSHYMYSHTLLHFSWKTFWEYCQHSKIYIFSFILQLKFMLFKVIFLLNQMHYCGFPREFFHRCEWCGEIWIEFQIERNHWFPKCFVLQNLLFTIN
jgi:hypothetical protein